MNCRLEAAFGKEEAWLRIHGRATYTMAPVLRDIAADCLRHGRHLLQLDLSPCLSMDSTFIGVLTKTVMDHDRDVLDIRMINTPDHVIRQIEGLGLRRFFRFALGTPPDTGWECVENRHDDAAAHPETLRETMIEAHETLGQAAAENVARFEHVIHALRKKDS